MRRLGMAAAAAWILAGSQVGAQSADDARLFQKLAGSWAGLGTVAVEGSADERIRCSADYSAPGPFQLHLALRCASDSFDLQVASNVSRDSNRIEGSWSEATTGVAGTLAGTASADRINASTEGAGLSAHLSVAVRRNTQTVSLTSQGPAEANATVTLRRR